MTILSLTCQYPTNNRQWHLTINGEERDLRRRGHYIRNHVTAVSFLGKGRNGGSDRKGGTGAVVDPRTHDIWRIDRKNGHECSITTTLDALSRL